MTRSEPHSPGAVFLNLVSQIERSLKKAKRPKAFRDPEAALVLRGQLFKLEGWAKLHRNWPVKKERKVFESIRDHAKRLEDAFGAVEAHQTMAKDLRRKRAKDLAELVDAKAEDAYSKLKKILKKDHWLGDTPSRTEKMRAQLMRIEWPSMSVQADFVMRAMKAELTHLGSRYREEWRPKLSADLYDRTVVEDDLHKFRRQLRWISMYFQTADGLIGLAPVSPRLTVEKKLLVKKYRRNPFTQLPDKKYVKTHIDTVAFYELTRLVEIIGTVKDRAENYFFVRDILVSHGAKKEDATVRVEQLYGDIPHVTPLETEPILAEFERLKPHAYLAESLFE